MPRLRNFGFSMRRRSRVLYKPERRVETVKERPGSTSTRIHQAEAGDSRNRKEVSGHRNNDTVQRKSSGSTRCFLVCGMQSLQLVPRVRFSGRTDICVLDDWPAEIYRNARKGPWMHYAVDRHRFRKGLKRLILRFWLFRIANVLEVDWTCNKVYIFLVFSCLLFIGLGDGVVFLWA